MIDVRDAGFWLRALAVLHAVVGLVIFREPLVDMVLGGLVNTAEGESPQAVAFWFMLFSPMLYLTGLLATESRARTGAYPRVLVLWTLGVCLVGTVIMPASGFPVGLVVCALALRSSTARLGGTVRPLR